VLPKKHIISEIIILIIIISFRKHLYQISSAFCASLLGILRTTFVDWLKRSFEFN